MTLEEIKRQYEFDIERGWYLTGKPKARGTIAKLIKMVEERDKEIQDFKDRDEKRSNLWEGGGCYG